MRYSIVMSLAVLGVIVLPAITPGLAAQTRPLRNGFWFGASAGYGRTNTPECPSCVGGDVALLSLRLGGKLSDHALLGLEYNGTMNGWKGSSRPSLQLITLTGYIYPAARTGLHLKAGFGIGLKTGVGYGSEEGEALYSGFVLGGAYDYRIAPGVSVVPSISWLSIPSGVAASVIHGGLGITVH
jgi:hypothetical protein